MKPRARRVVLGAALLVSALVAALAVANWGTVRDHVEAWHFQLTRETETYEPFWLKPAHPKYAEELVFGPASCFQVLSTLSNHRVIIDSINNKVGAELCTLKMRRGAMHASSRILSSLRDNGWHVVEQRVPWKAYVVIEAVDPPEQSLVWDDLQVFFVASGTERP